MITSDVSEKNKKTKMRTFENLLKEELSFFIPLENSWVKNDKICWRPTEEVSKIL